MPRKKETLTLSVPPGTKEKLEAIALRFGILWGKSPSPSGLVAAIAQEELQVGQQPLTLNETQVKALRQAAKLLIDADQIEEWKTIITLLLNYGNLEAPLHQSLQQQLHQPTSAWRNEVEPLIAQSQPFRLNYRNSQGQDLIFHARHAQVYFYEKRFYLQIWCDETADALEQSPELPEVAHNRCLRFDRIQNIEPIAGDWRGEFDTLKVYLHFRGWLANAYEPKPEDLENEVIDQIRRVVRRVVNPFWLIREVLRYGQDCEIVAPNSLRDRVKQELRKLCERYDMEVSP